MTYEFTPSTPQVRAHYVFDQTDRWDPVRGTQFDRWIAKLKADTLREYAAKWSSDPEDVDEFFIYEDVCAVADGIEKGAANDPR